MAAIPDAEEKRDPVIVWITFNGMHAHLRPIKSARKTLCGMRAGSGDDWQMCSRELYRLDRCEDCEAEFTRRYPKPAPPTPTPPRLEVVPTPPPAPPAKRSRSSARTNAAQRHKVALVRGGQRVCERCGHKPPRKLAARILHIHHVFPVALGGSDHESNLVLLCANCHALTHALTVRRKTRWYGPRTRDEYFPWIAKQVQENEAHDAALERWEAEG